MFQEGKKTEDMMGHGDQGKRPMVSVEGLEEPVILSVGWLGLGRDAEEIQGHGYAEHKLFHHECISPVSSCPIMVVSTQPPSVF